VIVISVAWGKVVRGLICACCRSKLKEHMQYCVEHPEEISKLAKVKAQVSEVKGVMMENIEKVKMLIQKSVLRKLNRSSINLCRSSLVVLRNFKSCVLEGSIIIVVLFGFFNNKDNGIFEKT